MSVSLKQSYDIEYDGARNVARMDIYIDDVSDLTGLDDIDDIYFLQGSDALDISTGDHYLRNSSGSWILQPSSSAFSNVYTKSEIDQMLTDYYTKTEADALFEWRTFTINGISSIDFISMGSPLTGWSLLGNMIQTGTPSSVSPLYPGECGDYVSSGDHAGDYAIPITNAGQTKTVYLQYPIRKIDDSSDIAISDGTVTRRIYKLVLTGNESGFQEWKKSSTYQGSFYAKVLSLMGESKTIVCSHAEYTETINAQSYVFGKCAVDGSNPDRNLNLFIGESSWTVNDFKSYLAAQYANGTPVTVWYILSNPTSEAFTAPTITPDPGENILTVDTSTPPSEITITGQIRET